MSEASPASKAHADRRQAPARVPTAVITVSDTRTPETDSGGAKVAELLEQGGHPVVSKQIIRDDVEAIRDGLRAVLAREDVRAVILTGGTGVAPRGKDFTSPLGVKQKTSSG